MGYSYGLLGLHVAASLIIQMLHQANSLAAFRSVMIVGTNVFPNGIYIYIHIIYIYIYILLVGNLCKNWVLWNIPVVWCLRGGLYPNLSRINFLGPSFFRNKFPFPKKGTTPRRTCTQKISRINFGTMGANISGSSSSGQGPVYPFESLQQTPLRETPHFSLVASVAEYFSMGQPP